MTSLTTVYVHSPNIVARKIAGEMVLVPIRQHAGDLASIYNLNEVGARIWELIDGGTSVAQLSDKVVAEYEVTPDQAETDISDYITQLEKIKAILPVNSEIPSRN